MPLPVFIKFAAAATATIVAPYIPKAIDAAKDLYLDYTNRKAGYPIVPNLKGATLPDAQETLANLGFYSTPIEVEADKKYMNYKAGTIIRTEPKANTSVPPSTTAISLHYATQETIDTSIHLHTINENKKAQAKKERNEKLENLTDRAKHLFSKKKSYKFTEVY